MDCGPGIRRHKTMEAFWEYRTHSQPVGCPITRWWHRKYKSLRPASVPQGERLRVGYPYDVIPAQDLRNDEDRILIFRLQR